MICFPLDNTDYSAKDIGSFFCTRTRGVFAADDNLAVTPAGSGLVVSVSPGIAWLKMSSVWGTSVVVETPQTLQLDPTGGTAARIDAIVLRLNKTANIAELVVKKGSESSSPVVSAPVRNSNFDEIYLATVRLDVAAVSVVAADITDQRLNEDYCGIMRDGVTEIPTAQLMAQAKEMIDKLQQLIDSVADGSAFVPKTGGTMTGVLKAMTAPAAATPQVRNIVVLQSGADPASVNVPDGTLVCIKEG